MSFLRSTVRLTVIFPLLSALVAAGFAQQASSFECPTAELIMPNGAVNIEEDVDVVLRVIGDFAGSVEWKATSGKIVKGQSSRILTIKADEEDQGTIITISAKLIGLSSKCAVEVSDKLTVAPLPIGEPVDVLERMAGSRKARTLFLNRLDAYVGALSISPDYEALIQVAFRRKDSRKHKISHLKAILTHLRLRNVDPSRVTFLISEGDFVETTTLWTAAPGARISKYMRTLATLKGEEFEQKIATFFIKSKWQPQPNK